MALEAWPEDKTLGKEPCKTDRETWQCPNMQRVDGDRSMTHEHYECKLCGKRHALGYDEMR